MLIGACNLMGAANPRVPPAIQRCAAFDPCDIIAALNRLRQP